MREFRSYGSVRGALRNERPYRDHKRRRIDFQALSLCIIPVQKYSAVSRRSSAKCWRRTRPGGGGARFELHQNIDRSYKIEGEPMS
jgi:hypothetical protein